MTLLLSFVVILTVVVAMGVGVIAGRKPIKGSCGGLGNGGCELCGGDENCENAREGEGGI